MKILKSWIESANTSSTAFPIQNLPMGVFKKINASDDFRIGIAIGDDVLDIKACIQEKLLDDLDQKAQMVLQEASLNAFMKLGKKHWHTFRECVIQLLESDNLSLRDSPSLKSKVLIPQAQVELKLPVEISNYTDFYASIHHATHVGSHLRPDNPLTPNYKYMPIGYHGRASTIVVSGTTIAWPKGQVLGSDNKPYLGFSQSLDFELELGVIIGEGNPLGTSIPIDEAHEHIFGFVLINDWSARDVQKWEYQPLGPFNSKNWATTISPWIVTHEALQHFQVPMPTRDKSDPPLLDYLSPAHPMTLNLVVEAYLSSEKMRANHIQPLLLCKGNFAEMYWTFDQMIAHHTISGCNLQIGDLLGSGTISGPSQDSLGCLLERAALKMEPIHLPDGTTRQYLENGDEIILRAFAQKEGYPQIGFGECRGKVVKRIEKNISSIL